MPNTITYLDELSGSSWERTLYASSPGMVSDPRFWRHTQGRS